MTTTTEHEAWHIRTTDYAPLHYVEQYGSVSTVCLRDRQNYDDDVALVRIPHTYVDTTGYSHGAIELSNRKALEDMGLLSSNIYVEIDSGFGGSQYAIAPDRAKDDADRELLAALADVIDGLGDYPVIDDMAWSEAEMALMEENLTGWVIDDLRSDLGEPADPWTDDDLLVALQEAWEVDNYYPELENTNLYYERVKVGQAMARVLRDWGVVTYDDGYDTELRSYVLTDAGFRMTAGPEDQRFWDAYFMEMEQLT